MLGVGYMAFSISEIFPRIAAGVERLRHSMPGTFMNSANALPHGPATTERRRHGPGDHHLAFAIEHLAHELAGLRTVLDEILPGERPGRFAVRIVGVVGDDLVCLP